jgi:hypothetical protein
VGRHSPAIRDGVCIAGVVLLSLVWYVPRLGFYSDDWAFLGLYATSADQTLRGLYDASYSAQHAMRPVQLWMCALLYRVFGLAPLGYHLVNAVLVVANALLVYAIACELRLPRTVAVSLALTYGLLPNYSTDRYWYVAFAITLSVTAGLAAIYALLRAWHAWPWYVVAVCALLVSALAYEVMLPLLIAVPFVLVPWRLWRERQTMTRRQAVVYALVLVAVNGAVLGGIAAFKLRTTVRLGAQQGISKQVGDIARHAIRVDVERGDYGLNVANAVRVHFVEYGIQLPANARTLARGAPRGVLVLTALASLTVLVYVLVVAQSTPWPRASCWALVLAAGLVVFGLGYAIFVTNYNVQFTPTGIANRTAIAAALGAAACLVGAIGLAATLVPSQGVRVTVFATAIALVTGSGFLIVNVTAEQWTTAYVQERAVLSGIRNRFPALPPRSTLLLEGVCPYVGPAIVFEANWDLAGALQAMYRDPTIAANVVTPRITVTDAGVIATLYRQPTTYPYSASLLAYDARTGVVQALPDAATAAAWLSRSLETTRCPTGREGLGVEPF